MERRVRIRVDYDRCVGSSICVSIAPNVFVLNKDRQASVVVAHKDATGGIWEAAAGCPMGAITVEDVDEGDVTSVGV